MGGSRLALATCCAAAASASLTSTEVTVATDLVGSSISMNKPERLSVILAAGDYHSFVFNRGQAADNGSYGILLGP